VIVKAGICVAYDWTFLKESLPAIYSYVDLICLSIDIDRKSWNGNIFDMDWQGFKQLIDAIDKEGKIKILEEPFFDASRTPIANECYQRKRMAEFLGAADWYVQIDTDEIIINAEEFINQLKKYKGVSRPVNIHGIWANLIKQTGSGFVYSILKTPPLATNLPVYDYGRTNGHFNIYTNTFLAHITWARPEEEVYYKLKNWGHSHEFNGLSFFRMWQALDDHNWIYLKDFHPMSRSNNMTLHFIKASNIKEFSQLFKHNNHKLNKIEVLKNNIWFSRISKVLFSIFDKHLFKH